MKIRNIAVTTLLAGTLALTGCVSGDSKLNSISVGMDKAEVVKILGKRDSTRANGNVEYWLYTLKVSGFTCAWGAGCKLIHFVQFQNGQVVAYGAWGDFDTQRAATGRQ